MTPGKCFFEVSVYLTEPPWTADNTFSLHLGLMSTLSAESITTLLLNSKYQKEFAPKKGVHRSISVEGRCHLWHGWNAVKVTTSAKNAFFNFEFYKKSPNWCFGSVELDFDYPQNLHSWTLQFDIFPDSKPKPLIPGLPHTQTFTAFPEGKINVPRITPEKIGVDSIRAFQKGYICLMEVKGNASWPLTEVDGGALLFVAANSPITPESEWSLVDLDYGSDYTPPEVHGFPIPVEVNSFPNDVTRLYARISSRNAYVFAPIFKDSLYHHIGFAKRY